MGERGWESVQGRITLSLDPEPWCAGTLICVTPKHVSTAGEFSPSEWQSIRNVRGDHHFDPLFPDPGQKLVTTADSGFTISAYISMESLQLDDAARSATHVMPIVFHDEPVIVCYQLDLALE